VCRNYADFLYLLLDTNITPIQNNNTALHSTLFSYTPLVIRGTDKNKQLTIIKPTQTGINRKKYTFTSLKSYEPASLS
jgi:hypothetical protein